jgi:hypothetical protein
MSKNADKLILENRRDKNFFAVQTAKIRAKISYNEWKMSK